MKHLRARGRPLKVSDKIHCTVPVNMEFRALSKTHNITCFQRQLYCLILNEVFDDIGKKDCFNISVSESKKIIEKCKGISKLKNNVWTEFKKLAEIPLECQYKNGNKYISHLFKKVLYKHSSKEIEFEIPEPVQEWLIHAKQFGRIDTYFFVGLKSKHSIKLYFYLVGKINLDNICSERSIANKENFEYLTKPQLEDVFEVGVKSYAKWNFYYREVIQKAVDEINKDGIRTPFKIQLEQVKKDGREVEGVKFYLRKSKKKELFERKLKIISERARARRRLQ